MRNLNEGVFRRSPQALHRRVGGDVILARPDRDDFDSLSSTAGAAWEILETPKGLDELVNQLSAAYRMQPHSIVSDVAELLLELLRRGWVEEVESNAS
jgi:Coenzyme PQQ synthesis protein D (PqqD)